MIPVDPERRGRARGPFRPIRTARLRSAASRSIASAIDRGSGSATQPETPSSTNSSGPPGVRARDHRLGREEALERHVPVVLVAAAETARRGSERATPACAAPAASPGSSSTRPRSSELGDQLGHRIEVGSSIVRIAGDHESDVGRHVAHRLDGEVLALDRIDPAREEDVVAGFLGVVRLARLRAAGRGRWARRR